MPEPQTRYMVDHALRYAKRGFPVFPIHESLAAAGPEDPICSCGRMAPSAENLAKYQADIDAGKTRADKLFCKNPGKHPRTRHGLSDASTDRKQVSAWWREWPNAPIGLVTGEESGLWVLDSDLKLPKLDPKDPKDLPRLTGTEAIAWLAAQGLVLPPTPTVRTGSGGGHFWFKRPTMEGKPKNVYAMRIPPCPDYPEGARSALDVRADGGYIVAPPSSHPSGGTYEFELLNVPLAEVPQALLDLCYPAVAQAPQDPRKWDRPASGDELLDEQRAYAEALLRGVCDDIRKGGGQHESRHVAIRNGAFKVGGYTPHLLEVEHARAELMAAGLSHKDKGQREVQNAVNSGLERGAQRPLWPPPSRKAKAREDARRHAAARPNDNGAPSDPPDPGGPTEEPPRPLTPEEEESNRRATLAGTALLFVQQVIGKIRIAGSKADGQREFGALLDATVVDGLAHAAIDDGFVTEAALNELFATGYVPRIDLERLRAQIKRRALAIEAADAEVQADVPRFKVTTDLVAALGKLAEKLPPLPPISVPSGYEVTPGGTWRIEERDDGIRRKQIIQRPMFLASLSVDVDGGEESGTIMWHDGRSWRSLLVARNVIGVARRLAEESLRGLPVSSQSANDLVGYFEAFLAENEPRLPRMKTSRVQGWSENGFLIGPDVIGPNGPTMNPTTMMAIEDAGLKELLNGYRSGGTWEGWLTAVNRVIAHPRIMLALLASLAPPLLKVLRTAPNFVIDFAGVTSAGKTTAMRVAASAWGYPHDKDGGIIRPWNSSPTFIDRLCAISNDLPVFLDDTKAVQKKDQIGSVLYMIERGTGKGRGTVTGVQATGTWRTVCLSTGESPATDYSPDGGAAARCLTMWGSPMVGGACEENRILSETLASEMLEHYGHAGRRVVAWLQHEANAKWARDQYASHRAKWGAAAMGDAVVGRASAYLAILDVTQDMCGALDIPTCTEDVFASAWQTVIDASGRADKASLALHAAFEYATAFTANFYGRHNIQVAGWDSTLSAAENATNREKAAVSYTPTGGWRGAWPADKKWTYIALLRDRFDDHLRELGYDPGAIVRTWADKGWLTYKKGDGYLWPAQVGREKLRCYVLKREAFATISEVESNPGGEQQPLVPPEPAPRAPDVEPPRTQAPPWRAPRPEPPVATYPFTQDPDASDDREAPLPEDAPWTPVTGADGGFY